MKTITYFISIIIPRILLRGKNIFDVSKACFGVDTLPQEYLREQIRGPFRGFIISLLLLNIYIPAYAFSEPVKETYVLEVEKPILISEKNQILNAFSPEEHNLDMTIGIILSIVPSFGVGHFWLGNTEAGYFFLNLDLIMLAIPLVITIVSTVFSSFALTSAETNTMQSSNNIFTILGMVAWASSLGVKVWETASVWKYITELRKTEKNKVNFLNNSVQVSLLSF